METAFEQFKEIIFSAFNKETATLKQEITDLKEQVNNLNKLLKEKDDQCRHIASVLHAKNSEWKRIKLKLCENKLQEHGRRDSAANDEVEVVIEQNDRMLQGNKDNSDDCTQLPPRSQSPQILEVAETQSHLDALIDLISENEDDRESYTNHLPISRNSSFTIESSKVQKIKSHARGCSCCDKFYSATRSPPSNHLPTSADSFLISPNTPPGFWDTSFTPRQ